MLIFELTCFYMCRNWDSINGKCEKLKQTNPINFNNPHNCDLFEPYLTGDKIRRDCGAVGHGCEECYIKCDDNPMTQEEDNWLFIMEWEQDNEYDPYG
jgi:hypothetical protein